MTENLFGKKKKKPGGGGVAGAIAGGAAVAAGAPVALVPLVVFYPMMRGILKKKGFKPPGNPVKLVKMFYQEIVKKSDSFEEENDIVPAVAAGIQGIVTAILSYIKKLKVKKKSDEPLTNVEEKVLEGSELAVGATKEYVKSEAQMQIGKYAPWVVGILAALFILPKILGK